MAIDMGSRDTAFIQIVQEIRDQLLQLSGISTSAYSAIPMQGCGTFAIEAALGSLIPQKSKLLLLINGAYGRRMLEIAHRLGIHVDSLEFKETEPVCPKTVAEYLAKYPEVQFVALVHCETTTGIMNPLEDICEVVVQANRKLMVDAMSSFGAIEIDLTKHPIDVLVASSNKCLQGVPGLAFVITELALLKSSQGQSPSVSLDLYEQWKGLEHDGQFRFTPPTHVILALHKAIDQLMADGGIPARHQRYSQNNQVLMTGMAQLGFQPVLAREWQSPIISTFLTPPCPNFDFKRFYDLLAQRDCLIYPGKLSNIDCFRIGTIGHIDQHDITTLLDSIKESLAIMRVTL